MGVLDKLTIALVGTLPHDAKQMRTWIERNGGKYSAKITKSVTHLIASKEAYKQPADAVQQATDLGIHVVSYDWFDDSLQGKRKLSAKKYTWTVLLKERRTRKELKRLGTMADGSKFRKGCEKIKELTGSEDYHYYQDVTGFEYKIVLVRGGESSLGMSNYHIGLLESHTKPHVYWALVQYKPAKGPPPPPASDDDDSHQQTPSSIIQHPSATRLLSLVTKPTPTPDLPYNGELCPRGSAFATASRSFRHAFRDLTLLSWEERFDPNKTLQKARAHLLNIEPFWYGKPKLGMPMGLLPQEAGMLTGDTTGLEVRGDMEDGYVRGASKLPSISAPLTRNGIIGGSIYRDEEDVRKREEARLQKIRDKEEAEMRSRGLMQARGMGVNHNRPMFNGVMGRPTVDAYGQGIGYGGSGEYTKYTVPMPSGGGGGDNRGFVAPEFAHLLGGGRKRGYTPFPSNRDD